MENGMCLNQDKLDLIAPFLLEEKSIIADTISGEIEYIKIPQLCRDKEKKYVFGIISLDNKLFSNRKVLKKIDIKDTKISKVEKDSFKNCTSLKEVILPNILMKIGESAFENCTSLKVLEIPDSVIVIGNSAFKGVESIIYNGPAVDDGKHWGAGKLYKTMEDYKKSKQKSIDNHNEQGYKEVQKVRQDVQSYQGQDKKESVKIEEPQKTRKENDLQKRESEGSQIETENVENKQKVENKKGVFSFLSGGKEKDSLISQLQSDNESLKSKIENLMGEVSYYQVFSKEKVSKLEEIEKELEEKSSKIKDLKESNKNLEKEKNDLNYIYNSLNEEYNKLEKKLNSYISNPEIVEKSFDEKLKYLFDVIKTLVNKNKIFSDNANLFDSFFVQFIEEDVLVKKQSVKEKIAYISDDIIKLQKDKKSLEDKYQHALNMASRNNVEVTKKQQELQKQNETLEQEVFRLNTQLDELTKGLADTKDYKIKYDESQKQVQQLQVKNTSLKKALDIDLVDFINAYEYGQKERLEDELKYIKSEKEELSIENKKLQDDLKEKEKIIQNATAQKGTDAGKIQKLQEDIKVLEEKRNEIIEKTDNKIETLTTEKGELQGQLKSKNEQIDDLKKRSKEDENKIDELINENGDLKGQLTAKNKEIENLKNTQQKHLEHIESLNKDVKNAKYEEGKINGLLQSERESKEQFEEEIKSLRNENTKLFSDNEIAVEREKELTKQKEDIEAKRDKLIEEKNNIKQKADDFEKKYKDKRDELDRVNDELKNINKELEKYKKQAGEAEKNLKFKEAEFEKKNEAYADFDELNNAYNSLSDDVKSDCKLIFGASDNIASIILNLSEKFNKFWDTLSNKVNEDKTSKEDIENLKKIFDISFTFMKLYDNRFERLKTKKGDRFDPSTMNKLQSATQVQVVGEVLLLGYTKLNITKKSLVR